MGQVVYADLLFLVNFSMDFLCFFVTARLLHSTFKLLRCLLGAAMGGVYSVLVLFISMNSILGLVADLGFCILMCLCAYGTKDKTAGEFFLHTTVYFGVSMGTGGCMTAMYSLLNRMELPLGEVEKNPDGISVWLFGLLAMISGAAALFGGRFFKKSSLSEIYEISVEYRGATLTVAGMIDTGNMLKDPISGKPVIVIDKDSLSGVVDAETLQKAIEGDLIGVTGEGHCHKARLISMHTASGRSMICAFVPERTTLRSKRAKSSKEVDALFAPVRLHVDFERKIAGCVALIPEELI